MSIVKHNEDGYALQCHWDEGLIQCLEDSQKAQREHACPRNKPRHVKPDDWTDRKGFKDVRALLDNPAPDAMRAIEKFRSRLEGNPSFQSVGKRRKLRRGLEAGDSVDVGRWMSGDVDCWERMERVSAPGRVIRIGVEASIAGGYRREDLLPRGAGLAAIAEWLTSAGHSVEIVTTFKTGKGPGARGGVSASPWYELVHCPQGVNSQAIGILTVKPAHAPLDMGSIATALCEIAWVRLVMLLGAYGHSKHWVGEGLGNVCDLTEEDKKLFGFDLTAGADLMTERQVEAWLKTNMDRFTTHAV